MEEEYEFEEIEKQAEVSLSPNEIESVDHLFTAFDKDNNGYIDTNEIKSFLETLGHKPSEDEVIRLTAEFIPEGETRVCNFS